MENENLSHCTMGKNSSGIENEGCTAALKSIPTSITSGQYEKKKLKTLIQQRVEFLFGADALVGEFRYPRKASENNENIVSWKLSPNASNKCESNPMHQKSYDLPVVRHLRPEFRSKLTLRTSNRWLSQDTENLSTHNAPLGIKAQNKGCHLRHLVCSELDARGNIEPLNNDSASTLCRKDPIIAPKIIVNDAENVVCLKLNNKCCETLEQLDTLPKLPDHCDLTLLRTLKLDNQGRYNTSKTNEDEFKIGVVAPAAFPSHKGNTGVDNKIQFPEMTDHKDGEKSSIDSKEQENESISLVQNGKYFLSLLESKQSWLLDLSQRVDRDVEALLISDVSEEIIGYLRSASGKARLLTSQKMEQFRELCIKNIHQKQEEKFFVTNADLQGFWDMIMLQVEHIESLFNEIETLRKNNWQQGSTIHEASPQDKVTQRSFPKTTRRLIQNDRFQSRPSSSTESKDKRQAQRKLLMEFKRKHKMAVDDKTIKSDQIEIFVDKVRKS